MGRYYHFSKKISSEQSKEIVKEMEELEDVDKVSVTADHSYLLVETKDDEFSEVMGKAVNICNRVAVGLELSFARFAV